MVVNSHPLYQLSYRGSSAQPRPDKVLYNNRFFVLPAFNVEVSNNGLARFRHLRLGYRIVKTGFLEVARIHRCLEVPETFVDNGLVVFDLC